MKQKPNETLDQWVRQTISQLPDAPPPGSSFDSERLWGQLRPELQAAPTRRKIDMVWWIAAACLAGLTLSWFWLHQSIADPNIIVAQRIDHKAAVPLASCNQNSSDGVVGAKPVFSEKKQPVVELKVRNYLKEKSEQKTPPLHIEAVNAEPQEIELPVIAEVPPVVEKLIERTKPNIAVTAPKRRFRVVHENELQAEEEARPKLYRTEHFVRIGPGERNDVGPSENRPALSLPLTHKPNQ